MSFAYYFLFDPVLFWLLFNSEVRNSRFRKMISGTCIMSVFDLVGFGFVSGITNKMIVFGIDIDEVAGEQQGHEF